MIETGPDYADAAFLKYIGRELLIKRMVGEDGVEVYTSAEIKPIEEGRVIAREWGGAED